jgi:hypothetical protein
MRSPVLTPMQMFDIVARERGFLFSPGGQIVWDETKTGAAAGGARAADSTLALIQVTNENGKSVILARGDHLRIKGLREHFHAEEKALNTLRWNIADDQKFPGGRMTVVVDQEPCPPEEHDCRGQLKRYAAQHDLELEVWLPRRPKMRGSGFASPKTATQSSMRTGYPGVELFLWNDF